ncbi:hypothetical protein GCM10029964_059450 [Kibdelosporangium lantanae]
MVVRWVERHPVLAASVGVVIAGGVVGAMFGLLEPDIPTWALVALAVAAAAITGVTVYVRRNHNPCRRRTRRHGPGFGGRFATVDRLTGLMLRTWWLSRTSCWVSRSSRL